MTRFTKHAFLFPHVTWPDLAEGTMVMPEIKRSLHDAMKYQQHLWPCSFLSFIKLFTSQIVMWCGRNTAFGHTQWKNSVILCARNNSVHRVLCIVVFTIFLSSAWLARPPLGHSFTWYTRSPFCSSRTIVSLLQTASKLQYDSLKCKLGSYRPVAMRHTARRLLINLNHFYCSPKSWPAGIFCVHQHQENGHCGQELNLQPYAQ